MKPIWPDGKKLLDYLNWVTWFLRCYLVILTALQTNNEERLLGDKNNWMILTEMLQSKIKNNWIRSGLKCYNAMKAIYLVAKIIGSARLSDWFRAKFGCAFSSSRNSHRSRICPSVDFAKVSTRESYLKNFLELESQHFRFSKYQFASSATFVKNLSFKMFSSFYIHEIWTEDQLNWHVSFMVVFTS